MKRAVVISLLAIGFSRGQEEFDRNAFAHAYNTWAELAGKTLPGQTDVKEWQAWGRVKEEWKKFQREIDAEHKGR